MQMTMESLRLVFVRYTAGQWHNAPPLQNSEGRQLIENKLFQNISNALNLLLMPRDAIACVAAAVVLVAVLCAVTEDVCAAAVATRFTNSISTCFSSVLLI